MKIYLVGGAVRDKLLNFPVFDRDWVVVGSSPEEMLAAGYQAVGHDFPVFIHPETGEEYALARTERKSGKGYTGFQYSAAKDVTLEEDLLRRDLTINAMAMDDHGQLFDPYNGQLDLENRTLRHVSPAFSEDPLRVLRVARFAARYHHLGFSIAPETMELMRTLSAGDELEYLTAERVWKEFERALTEPSPEVFLETLNQAGALTKVLPELAETLRPGVPPQFTDICQNESATHLRFACLISLCQPIEVKSFCDRLRTSKAVKELADQCYSHHANLSQFDRLPADIKLNTLLQLDLIRRPHRLKDLLSCVELLHEKSCNKHLQPVLQEIDKIQPKQLISEGFQGSELGNEINRRRLEICQQYTLQPSTNRV